MAIRRNGEPQTCPRPDPVERAEQCYRVVELKGEGKTFPEIAEEMQCAVSTAHKLFKKGLQLMAPPDAADEVQAIRLQLELQYREIMEDLRMAGTDLEMRSKFRKDALANLKLRWKMFGSPETINVKHTVQTQFDAELEKLHKSFEEDQEIRNGARARQRSRR